jgi:hypothetical protein
MVGDDPRPLPPCLLLYSIPSRLMYHSSLGNSYHYSSLAEQLALSCNVFDSHSGGSRLESRSHTASRGFPHVLYVNTRIIIIPFDP